MQAAVSEDHRAAILTAQLTVPLADVKQDMRCQFMDIRDYPRSVMPGALCYWVFNSHRRWTMRELRLGIAPSRDGTFRTVWSASLSDWICRQGMDSGVLKK